MTDFLLNYGLFIAKALTVVISIIIVLGFIVVTIFSKKKEKEDSYLAVESINEKLENLQDSLESEIFAKPEYKKLQKQRKKEKKLEEKQIKKIAKSEDKKPKIFVLKFHGDLSASNVDNLREEITAILTVAKPIDEIVVLVDSHGGIVHNYGFAAAQLQRITQKNIKLVVAVDLIAASGGYMMACVANKIIAAPFAIVGSIGVLAQIPNFNKLLTKHDIEIEHHTSGEYKSTLTTLGKNTEKGREKFIAELNETHDLFKEFVKQHRPSVDIEFISTGEYWYGSQAINLNLIDEIITSDDYLIEKSKDHDIFAVEHKVHESLTDKIHNMISGSIKFVWQKLSHTTTQLASI